MVQGCRASFTPARFSSHASAAAAETECLASTERICSTHRAGTFSLLPMSLRNNIEIEDVLESRNINLF